MILRSRLDCEPIKGGLIMNHCMIWSNSPLERRTYAEEETEQIHSNRRDLEPNICVNRVNSVNQSFILKKLLFRLDLSS